MIDVKTNKTNNSIKGSFFGVLYKLIGIICPFIIRTIIIYTLGREYIGLNSLFTSILSILSLSELGIGSAMTFNLYKPINDDNVKLIAAYMNFFKKIYRIIGLVIFVSGLILLPFINFFIEGEIPTNINIYLLYIIYLINTCISYFFFAYRTSLLNAYQRSDIVSNVASISSLFLYITQIILLLLFNDYYIYILVLPISTIINNLLIYIFSKKLYRRIDNFNKEKLEKGLAVEVFKNTSALFGHKVGSVLIIALPNILISTYLGLIEASIFNNYFYVITALNSLFDIVVAALLFSIGNYLVNHSKEEKEKLFRNLSFLLNIITSFCSICIFCLIQDFIKVWIGTDNMYDSLIASILFSLYFYSSKFRIMGVTFKDAAGMWKNDILKPYIGIVSNLILGLILVQSFGALGSIVSVIIVFLIIYFPWETKVLYKDLFDASPKKYLSQCLIMTSITFISSLLVKYISDYLVVNSIGMFVFKMIFVCFLSFLILVLSTFYMEGFKYCFQKILMFLKKIGRGNK